MSVLWKRLSKLSEYSEPSFEERIKRICEQKSQPPGLMVETDNEAVRVRMCSSAMQEQKNRSSSAAKGARSIKNV